MSGSYQHQQSSFGELMECLMRERESYPTEEEFRAFAIGALRRFIVDLRGLDIEISLRPNHYDRLGTQGPSTNPPSV
jgi:hypothetical protein